MALTLSTLIAGGAVLFVLPVAIFWLNEKRPHAGWWLLLAAAVLMIVGNAAEKLITGSSPLF